MKKLTFEQAEWIPSIEGKPLYSDKVSQIALVGKSNVGKSSLINHLLRGKKIAKTSSTPGKTRDTQFFLIDRSLLLVDLPGYGYAKVSKSMRLSWGEKIEHYLQETISLKGLIFLCDSRRKFTEEDLAFLNWTKFYKVSILILFTKADKIDEREKEKNLKHNLEKAESILEKTPPYLFYSIKDGKSRSVLIATINRFIKGSSWD